MDTINETYFKEQAKQCWLNATKKEITEEQLDFALQYAKEQGYSDNNLYHKPNQEDANKIGLKIVPKFNYVISYTYKHFLFKTKPNEKY